MKKVVKVGMRNEILTLLAVVLFACGVTVSVEKEAFAKCEKALERLKAAEAELKAANAAYDAAAQNAKQAAANLAQAVANLNAVAANLGVQGRATAESVTFGRSPTNPAFFDDPGYKATKQAWQDAKAANAQAEGEVDQAGERRQGARDEYDDAKKEYDKLRREHLMEERAGDEGLLLPPEPLKIDEKLSDKVNDIIQYQLPADKPMYDCIKLDEVIIDVGYVYKKVGNKKFLETSILTTGKGSHSRRWSTDAAGLVMGSTALKPLTTSNYYVSQEKSSTAGVAPYIFTAIGSQYKKEGVGQYKSKGGYCPTGGDDKGGYNTAKGINLTGMAAGMSLLASQAKAKPKVEMKGLRATFDVTGHEEKLKGSRLKVTAENRAEGKEIEAVVPLHFE